MLSTILNAAAKSAAIYFIGVGTARTIRSIRPDDQSESSVLTNDLSSWVTVAAAPVLLVISAFSSDTSEVDSDTEPTDPEPVAA